MVGNDQLSIEARRAGMVADLQENGDSLHEAVINAFNSVPRHLFVPGVYLDAVYRDNVIVTRRDKNGYPISSSNQPSVMAVMLDALDVHPGHNILEIGAGTGYNAALLTEMAGPTGEVTAIEIEPDIAEEAEAHLGRAGYTSVHVVVDDGSKGYLPHAPYDRIIATVSVWDLPDAWIRQLKPGGLLVVPLRFGGLQVGAVLRKQVTHTLLSEKLFAVGFVPLQGAAAPPDRTIQVGSSALMITLDRKAVLNTAGLHTLLSEDHDLTQLPLQLDRRNLGKLSYYPLFHEPEKYVCVTYKVEDSQMAYGLTGIGWGIISPTSACLVPYGDERVVHVFGASDAFITLSHLAESWATAGQPDLAKAHLGIAPADQTPVPVPEGVHIGRVCQRPAHTFTLWLENNLPAASQ